MARPRFGKYALYYSLRRAYVDAFMQQQATGLRPGSRVLDLGGHKQGKRGHFDIETLPLHIIYTDISTAKQPDIQADATAIPYQGGSFDVVICSELLEHVRDPGAVIAEAHRVLQPGGILLITVPFLYPIHADPFDFGRYTDRYWRALLQEAGFQQIKIERQGTFYAVLFSFLKLYVRHWNQQSALTRMGKRAVALALLLPLHLLTDCLEQSQAQGGNTFLQSFTTGFGIRALKGGQV